MAHAAGRSWEHLGFRRRPRVCTAEGGEKIFRVGGGPSSHLLGRFFSFVKPRSVLEAELRFRIVEYGNRCFYVATYEMYRGIVYLLGDVAHGASDMNIASEQIFIEDPVLAQVRLLDLGPLRQDRTVVSGPARWDPSTSSWRPRTQ